MENQISKITAQHTALRTLIEDVYKLDLKAFLIDAAELIEGRSDSEALIESLWECAQMCPNDPSRPK